MNRNTFDEIAKEETFNIVSPKRGDSWSIALRA
jgi:hypothetical protein